MEENREIVSWNRGKMNRFALLNFKNAPRPHPLGTPPLPASVPRSGPSAPPSSLSVCSWHFEIFYALRQHNTQYMQVLWRHGTVVSEHEVTAVSSVRSGSQWAKRVLEQAHLDDWSCGQESVDDSPAVERRRADVGHGPGRHVGDECQPSTESARRSTVDARRRRRATGRRRQRR